VLVPDVVPDVVPVGVPPTGVLLVELELDVPSAVPVPEGSVCGVVPSVRAVGSVGLAPPVPTPAEMPPVEIGARLCRIVAVVEEDDSFVFAAAVSEEVCPLPLAAGAWSDRIWGITIADWLAVALSSADVAAGCAAGFAAGAIATVRARWW